MTRLDKMKEFYNTLSIDIDLAYFADEDHTCYEDLESAIEDGDGFNVDIIYYSNAMKYLSENDPSLSESLSIAAGMGFSVESLNSEILASLLASQNAREDFYHLRDEIEEFFNELEN